MYKRGYPYRCSHCEGRRTLRRRAEEYVRLPRCTSCRWYRRRGEPQRWRYDRYRARVERAAPVCHCDGYWFQHRPGSLWCRHHPTGPSPEAIAERYGREPEDADACPF